MKTQLFCIAAGKPGGGTFLPKCTTTKSVAGAVGAPAKVNGWGPFFANDSEGYISYGTGQFDGQGSGHQFGGTVWHPTHGYNNNCDGGINSSNTSTFNDNDKGNGDNSANDQISDNIKHK